MISYKVKSTPYIPPDKSGGFTAHGVKTGSPSFVEICPFHKERVMNIYKQADCPDFSYLNEVE